MPYPKNVEELKENAVIYWPSEIAKKERNSSIIPLLLATQDHFISVLHLADKDPYAWTQFLSLTDALYPNLFLKHLCILSDIGGESLKRFATELPREFQNEDFQFLFRDEVYRHKMNSLFRGKKWSNPSLGLDGEGLLQPRDLTQDIRDVSILILFGSLSTNTLPEEIENKCIIGSMLGDKTRLEKYIKERYIWVSRITGGATSNKMGNLAQDYVKERLAQYLPHWDFSKSTIPGISQNEGRTDTRFDIVGTNPDGSTSWGIEVSFQFTTNSVVERKAKLASDRQALLHDKGHKVAYVVDGAGNFERRSFVQDLIDYSDCIVNFSEGDIKYLAQTMEGQVSNGT